MRAVFIEKFGGSEVLQQGDLPKPVPQPDEVLIKIAYAGVNPVDWKIREGHIQSLLPHEFPVILGWDASGTVEAVGDQVQKFKEGDKVYAYCRKPTVQHGCYAEYITVQEQNTAFAPQKLDFAHATSIPLAGLTAWQSLFDFAGLKEGQTALIHAGAGGVGSLAIQFAKYVGAYVYSTASARNHEYVKGLGADIVIDYNQRDFLEVIRQQHPQGVDCIYDTVGSETLTRSFDIVKQGGTLVSIVEPPDENLAEQKGVKAGFVFVSPNGEQLTQIAQLIDAGTVQPLAIEKMKLADAAEALRLNQERHVRGKIVLEI